MGCDDLVAIQTPELQGLQHWGGKLLQSISTLSHILHMLLFHVSAAM